MNIDSIETRSISVSICKSSDNYWVALLSMEFIRLSTHFLSPHDTTQQTMNSITFFIYMVNAREYNAISFCIIENMVWWSSGFFMTIMNTWTDSFSHVLRVTPSQGTQFYLRWEYFQHSLKNVLWWLDTALMKICAFNILHEWKNLNSTHLDIFVYPISKLVRTVLF